MKSNLIFIIRFLNRILYPSYNLKDCPHSPFVILKTGIFQKVFGFNRRVPWPVHRSSVIKCPEKIKIGTRTPGLGVGCYLDGRDGIDIGKNVWIGPYVKIISMSHEVNDYDQYKKTDKIMIGDNCWLAANVIILPSVVLGPHTVVAAGAVVTKSFPAGDQLVGGNPARIIKKLPDYNANDE